jgi:nucleotide-binding universal stress UspA family protein
MNTVHTILFPTDFSETAGFAFQTACALARERGARLLILHVISPPITHAEVVARAAPDSYRDQLWHDLLKMRPSAGSVNSEVMLAEGYPAEEIVQAARDNECDLIVMSTHGRTGLRRLLMGSVAEHALRHATCPVLAVRAPLPQLEHA